MQNKSLIYWVIGGAAAGIIVIAVALSNGIIVPFGSGGNTTPVNKSGGNLSAPTEVSYDQSQAYATSATAAVVTGTPDKPSESLPISKDKIPDAAIKLSVAHYAFNPSSFTVSAGQTVTLSLTSTDSHGHSLVFVDPSLASVNIGVGPGETRVTTFIAPKTPGSYGFQCNTFGDAARGETGTMIVK